MGGDEQKKGGGGKRGPTVLNFARSEVLTQKAFHGEDEGCQLGVKMRFITFNVWRTKGSVPTNDDGYYDQVMLSDSPCKFLIKQLSHQCFIGPPAYPSLIHMLN